MSTETLPIENLAGSGSARGACDVFGSELLWPHGLSLQAIQALFDLLITERFPTRQRSRSQIDSQ